MRIIIFLLFCSKVFGIESSYIELAKDGYYIPDGSQNKHRITSGYLYSRKEFSKFSKTVDIINTKLSNEKETTKLLTAEVKRLDDHITKSRALKMELEEQRKAVFEAMQYRLTLSQEIRSDLEELNLVKKKIIQNKNLQIKNINRKRFMGKIKKVFSSALAFSIGYKIGNTIR